MGGGLKRSSLRGDRKGRLKGKALWGGGGGGGVIPLKGGFFVTRFLTLSEASIGTEPHWAAGAPHDVLRDLLSSFIAAFFFLLLQ